MKYRLDEPIFKGICIKKFVWIEPYFTSKAGNEIYTERYERINLADLLGGRFTRDHLSWHAY